MYHPSEYSVAHAVDPATYLTPMTYGLDEPDDDGDEDDRGFIRPERLPPPTPTMVRPGTDEKVAILAERYDRGLDLWHDEDVSLLGERAYGVLD